MQSFDENIRPGRRGVIAHKLLFSQFIKDNAGAAEQLTAWFCIEYNIIAAQLHALVLGHVILNHPSLLRSLPLGF